VRAVPRLSQLYPGIWLKTEENARKNLRYNHFRLTKKKNLSLYPLLKCENRLRTTAEFRPKNLPEPAASKQHPLPNIRFLQEWNRYYSMRNVPCSKHNPVYIFVSFDNRQHCTVFVRAVCLCSPSCTERRSVICDTWRLFWRLPTTSCIEWLPVFEVIQKLKAESVFSDVIKLIQSCAA
jgi:hypothetical protein